MQGCAAVCSSKDAQASPAGRRTWKTAGVDESRGLIVFLFLISGSFSTPPLAPSVSLCTCCCRSVQRSKQLRSTPA